MRRPEAHTSPKTGKTTWRVRFRDTAISETTGKRLQSSETFDTFKEAARFAALIQNMTAFEALGQMDLEGGGARVPTLDAVADAHIAHLTGVEDGTRLTYARLWHRTWGPLIGSVPANAVTRDRVADATNELARRYSGKSLKNQRGLLAAVCERAVDQGHLRVNPTKGLRLPRGAEHERTEMRVLSPAEVEAIVDHTHDHYRPLMQFLASTGCRWGEAVALTVGDLDLSRPDVRIRRALKWSPDNKRTIGATKTARGNRTLPLAAGMADVLRAVVDGRGRADLVFTAPRGGPVLHRTFWSDVWFPAVEGAGVGEPRPRIHDLRHSYASRLLGAGVPIHVVQRLLGHESIKTTVDTYSHLMPDALTQATQAAALAFAGTRQIEG